jgi:hypothetical protein
VIERELQAGRDTSEWAYDRADVRARVKHDRAKIIESWTAGDYAGHRYLARLNFDRAEIERIEMRHQPLGADVILSQASLFDAQTNTSTPLSQPELPLARWRKLQEFEQVELYENLRNLPRAWFVRRVQAIPHAEVLAAVKTGALKDGKAFDPAETALLEREHFAGREHEIPQIGDPVNDSVKVTRYEPQRIEVQTRNDNPGFLVLSEIYYRGWDAEVNGKRVPVQLTDYALRGVRLPAGEHRVTFVFRAPSFWNGAKYSVLGVVLLVLGALIGRRRKAR